MFKLHGKVVEDPVLVFPDLLLDEPLCIYRNSKPTAMKRIQLTGLPTLPRVGTTADLEGKLEIDEINDPSLHLSGENITFEVTNVLNGAPETDLIAPIEERAAIYDRSSKGLKAINASVLLVRNAGYTCTSVSAAIPWTFRSGFRLTCNQSQYVYDIEDKGGNWVVTVE